MMPARRLYSMPRLGDPHAVAPSDAGDNRDLMSDGFESEEKRRGRGTTDQLLWNFEFQ